MSDSDILERAKAIHEKYASRDESIDEVFQAHLAADLLPELIAEVERLRAALAHELDLRDRHIESLKARIADQEAYIERLEAACVKLYVNEMVGCNMPREVAEKQACEALERIKEGGKDEN